MQENRIYDLLRGYYMHTLTRAEWTELSGLLEKISLMELEATFLTLMSQEASHEKTATEAEDASFEQHLQTILSVDKIVAHADHSDSRPASQWKVYLKWVAIAASIIGILWTSNQLWKNQTQQPVAERARQELSDLLPGTDGGKLTMSNGETIDLDGLPDGKLLSKTNDNVIIRVNRSQATYSIIQEHPASALQYQQIETPKGRRYKVGLSDGTNVWLNAASKLRYPLQFAKDHREVTLAGEAYFEVAHNAKKPFRVRFENQKETHIEVLGTKFNVNYYPENDGITTSLLEGKVRVHNRHNDQILAPGDRVTAYANGEITFDKKREVQQATAWKENYFHFEQADIRTLMTELARWYDFEVVFPAHLPKERYSGKIGKDLTFHQIVKILGTTRLKYKLVADRKVIILE